MHTGTLNIKNHYLSSQINYNLPMKQIILFFLFILSSLEGISQLNKDSIAITVGTKIESQLYEGKISYLDSVFDSEAFFDKILIKKDDPKMEAFNSGFRSAKILDKFTASMITTINNGGYVTFVNFYDESPTVYNLIFRMHSEAGLNYLEFVTDIDDQGHARITDIFVYITGQYISETLRFVYLPMAQEGFEDDITSATAFNVISLAKIQSMIQEKKLKEAKKLYYILPDSVRNSTVGRNYELQILEEADSIRYKELMNEMVNNSSSLAAYYMAGIDKNILDGNFDKSLECIDSLYSYTGDDFLDLYRGNINFAAGRNKIAIYYFEHLAKNYPYLPEAYDNLLAIYYLEEDYPKMIGMLDNIVEKIELTPQYVDEVIIDSYPILQEKAEYKAWKKSNGIK